MDPFQIATLVHGMSDGWRYAGIGARATPPDVLDDMRTLARNFALRGAVLRSGGAKGADSAFAEGAGAASRIFRPADATPEALALAERHHQYWDRCKPYVRGLFGRNCQIVLGRNLDDPVSAVLCWTPLEKPSAGTAHTLAVAREAGVPILNLADDLERKCLLDAAATPPFLHRVEDSPHLGMPNNAQVLNMKQGKPPPDAVRIDRATTWGNPFKIGADAPRREPHAVASRHAPNSREGVIQRYALHLWEQLQKGAVRMDDLASLHDKKLACWCAPKPCHGDVLMRAGTWAAQRLAAQRALNPTRPRRTATSPSP